MKTLKSILIFLMILGVRAQEGTITKELNTFSEVKAFDGLSVKLIKSNENKAIVKGANTNKVAIVNNGGVLKLRMEIDKIFSGYRTFVELYHSGELKVLDTNEDARISSGDTFEQGVLELKAQEGGELEINCQVEQLLIKSVTGGDVVAKGFSKNQDIIINTGGTYNGKEFKTEFTTISVNAGGRASIYATEYVKATVKAGGEVEVYGDPLKMDEKTVFGGKVKRM
ncbi:head GIN domain-containing protein [Flagellimonas meridianipacifica]|uniref:Putative autotransporter adhesin-like protein n=1 Tax=Flagellimonas meridianipacifica TaxID=1080225 RepID=A0A2T0MH40_9FLAO|nr:head GIN domain-containing protein [Allomuricauda pacifica]PRX56898.1 putative autotransporter adhesin-like protein [Allomuricauda pacifica]